MKRQVTIGMICLVIGAGIGHLITRQSMFRSLKPTMEKALAKDSPTRTLAREIIVPKISFDGAESNEAVAYLRGITRPGLEFGDLPKPKSLNFVIVDPNHTAKPITLDLREVRLDLLCERIAQVAGLTVSFDEDAIVFAGRNNPGESGRGPQNPLPNSSEK